MAESKEEIEAIELLFIQTAPVSDAVSKDKALHKYQRIGTRAGHMEDIGLSQLPDSKAAVHFSID